MTKEITVSENSTREYTIDEIKRMELLLKVTHYILEKCYNSHYVISPMDVSVVYDYADCDGFTLMNDIASILDLDQIV